MADNDIYNNEKKYINFLANLEKLLTKDKSNYHRKYYCKNPVNLQYFKRMAKLFDRKDNSFIRRLRLFRTLLIVVHVCKKDLVLCDREDIDEILAFSHSVNKSSKSKEDFIKDVKYIWKSLFPEKDEKDRIDETITPYVIRHLSPKIEKSKEKLRNDRLTWEEFEKLLNYFNNDSKMQAFLTISLESLSRPQEILYTRIKDVEISDNYAKIIISEHGKEGTKFLQCIDSYPYLTKWLNEHPLKKDKNSFLFIGYDKRDVSKQLNPNNINERIRNALKTLGIDKAATCYSIKRNGVTFARLRGDSDISIQHRAGWTSTRQLRTYDLSDQEDSFKMELVKRGLVKDTEKKFPKLEIQSKECLFCNCKNKFTDDFCSNCKRPLDREQIRQYEEKQADAMLKLKQAIVILAKNLDDKTKDDLKKILG